MDKLIEAFKSADLNTPHSCSAGYIVSNMGVDIEEEHAFQEELHGIVDKMKEDLVHETKILEGTLDPVYDPQNELSASELQDSQWKTGSLNGCSTIGPTHISNTESNISPFSVGLSSQGLDTHVSEGKSFEPQGPSCPVIWADCGKETEPSSESSDYMAQTTNVPMLGMPSEEK
jgi:hypothetical protein